MPKSTAVEKRFAVCIGINSYSSVAGLSQLAHAEHDAQEMDALLGELGFASENRCLLLGEAATLQAVNDALSTFILDRPHENDLVIFYFAGHSLPLVINQYAVEDEGAEPRSEVFLTTYDFDRQRIKEFPAFRRQDALGMGRLRTWYFEGEGSRKRLFLFDSCYSGDFFGPRYRDEADPVQGYIKHVLGTSSYGRVALSSCLPVQKAAEDSALGHGRFTYYVLEALSGRAVEALGRDGCLTVNGLFEYLTHKLPSDQRPVLSGVQQDTFTLVCYPEKRTETNALAWQDWKMGRAEKEGRLRAMLSDHTGFLRKRLVSFVGREQELVEIRQRIAEHMTAGGYVMITGQAGQGKSSIIAKLVDEYGHEDVAYHFIPFNPGPDHQVGLMRNLMARLILKYDLSELYVASDSRPALRDYFPHVLSDVRAKGGSEVIFLDGLDQLEEDATGVRDLTFLPTNPPPGIVFVLGTRPNDTLKPLELLKPHDEYWLPNLSREDFDRILQHRQVTLERTLADRFYQAMQENALYLDLIAQELAKSRGVRPEEIIERVATNPENLFSLSMRRLKRQKLEWREVVKPILGILLVAREPCSFLHIRQILHLDADRLREGIERLGGLVSHDGSGRYALFHLKFYDYLRQDEMNPEKDYIFARDEEETWHKTLANWCEQGNIQLIWADAPSNRIEQERRVYARKHFIAHLYFAQDWHRVFAVLDAHSFGQMKVRYDPSTRAYSDDLDLGRKAASWENWTFDEGVSLLPHLWCYTLLRCSLASRADHYPEAAFRILMLLGREQEALGLTELLTNRAKKVHILITMVKAREQQQKGGGNRTQEERFINLLLRAYEVACTIEDSYNRAKALSELGAALAHAQQKEQAQAVWAEAKRVIGTIEDGYSRAKALSELGAALAHAQQKEQAQAVWAEAERVIGTIEDSYSRAKALSELGAALAHAQQKEQAQAVWAEAKRVIGTIEDSYSRAKALSELGAALAHAQQWAEAERVIGTIGDGSSHAKALSELGAALAHAQQWAEAERVIGTIEDGYGHAKALRELGAALAHAQQWAEAERVIGTINLFYGNNREKALRELGAALAHAQQWAEAERVIGTISLSYSSYRASALSELGAALAHAQQKEQAQAVWAEAERVIGTIKDIDYNVNRAKALSELGAALARAQQKEQAQAVWAEAERVIGTIEDSYSRAKALHELGAALAHAQQWAEAERVIGTIIDIANYDNRAKALRELGAALAHAQQWAEAERVIGTIEGSDNRAKALSELGLALAHAQQWAEAERVIGTINPSYSSYRASALSELGAALAHAQQWAEAERWIGTIEDSYSRASALSELGLALAHTQQWAEAERVIDTINLSYSSYRAKALSELGAALAHAQQWAEAERVIGTIEDSSYRAKALRGLGLALAHDQQWAEAERVIGTINLSYGYNRANALSELGAALAHAQQKEQAQAVWAEAKRVIDTINPFLGDSRTKALRELGAALAHAQQKEQAQAVWAEAERVIGTIIDNVFPDYRAKALSELGAALAHDQQWAEAERVIGTIIGIDIREKALSELGAALAHAQQWAEAERVIGTIIIISSYRAKPLSELGAALAHDQQWAEAERVIGTIIDNDYPDNRAKALSELGLALAHAQQWAEAERVIGTINLSYSSYHAKALSELGLALAHDQQWAEAERVIGTIIDSDYPDYRAKALSELGLALAHDQQWAEAERVIGTINLSYSSYHAKALSELGLALAHDQQWAEAERVIGTIIDSDNRAKALSELGLALMNANKHLQLVQLVQRSWQQADTRDDTVALLSLANSLMPLKPEIGIELFESFSWVDDFLKS